MTEYKITKLILNVNLNFCIVANNINLLTIKELFFWTIKMDIKNDENREEDHKLQFGRRLAQAMLLTKYSNAALAKAIGVSEPMIKKYVDGKNLPKADILQKISLALGVDVSLLLDAEGEDSNCEEKDLEFLNHTFKYLTVLQRKIVLRQLSETVSRLLKLEENYLTKK